MSVTELAKNRRTIRKFSQKAIPATLLESYVEIARLSPSGANLQPLKYAILQSPEKVSAVFPYTKWAGYLGGSYTPKEAERPTAFIAVMKDTRIPSAMAEFDAGAAIMTMNLAAEEDGIGCCIMGAIDRENICRILGIPQELELMYLVALGYKQEFPTYVDMEQDNVKYFVENGTLTVPKRTLSEVFMKF